MTTTYNQQFFHTLSSALGRHNDQGQTIKAGIQPYLAAQSRLVITHVQGIQQVMFFCGHGWQPFQPLRGNMDMAGSTCGTATTDTFDTVTLIP